VVEINIKNKKTYNGDGEYIARPSPLGNPFKISKNFDRHKAISYYANYLKDVIINEEQASIDRESILSELERLFSILIDQQNLNLICWCSPLPCHGNIIKQILLNKYYLNKWLDDNKIGIYGL